MEINEKNLKLIGFSKEKNKKSEVYFLMSNGYKICLSRVTDDVGKPLGKSWRLYYINELKAHWITHIDEIFGLIAEDFYNSGEKEAKKQVKDFLFNIED